MVNSAVRRVYRWKPIQWILTTAGLDFYIRKTYKRFQEIQAGTTNFESGDISVELSETTVPDEEMYLEPEEMVLDDLLRELGPDDIFWDIGADEGLYTCLASEKITNGSVVAFEPHPVRRNRLERNLERNRLTAILRTEALTNTNGTAEFGYAIQTDNKDGEFTATLRMGDDLVSEEKVCHPSVLKIDVEGAEYEVIQGMKSTLSSSECRLVYCELHDIEGRGFEGSKQKVKDTLEELGFEISTLTTRVGDGWEQPYLKAEKVSLYYILLPRSNLRQQV